MIPQRKPFSMNRSSGGAASRAQLVLLAVCGLIAACSAGPLESLPNVTSADVGLKEGSCAVGDVVYLPGDVFPGAGPCERCACAAGGVRCTRPRCEKRPGCKALHRPDQCCPTYQCECELEGRVYGNGEKLVDPADPCRVCYCQGGEVVCRRIACFVRDDCRPRLVPGRCCPEYDNCPLRGVTTIPGAPPSMSTFTEDAATSAIPSTPKENIKQEITIKEITPVSEIPVISDVKIKEILPSPSVDVAEYSSSKSPLVPREATSEKSVSKEEDIKVETPSIKEIISPSTSLSVPSRSSEDVAKTSKESITKTQDAFPPKITYSSQDAIKSEMYPSNVPSMGTTSNSIAYVSTTKAPIIEEEDPSLFDHDPAFPPLPDDLSVLSNHEDEILPEQHIDGHLAIEEINTQTTEVLKELPTTSRPQPVTEAISTTTERIIDTSTATTTAKQDTITSTEFLRPKQSSMLNLRSAIPTEILNIPSELPEDINGELDDLITEQTPHSGSTNNPFSTNKATITNSAEKVSEFYTRNGDSTERATEFDTSTHAVSQTMYPELKTQGISEQTTNSIAKSNIATEVTSQTELSSLPIETSDQNPHETIDNVKDKSSPPSAQDLLFTEAATTKAFISDNDDGVTSTSVENKSLENIETTEFVLSSFGSSESVTDAFELIKIVPDSKEKAAIIEPAGRHKNVLTDLINLVGDVASIGDHTDEPGSAHVPSTTGIAESEELIPVNAGYKSKNNNWNLNSITEIPLKSKNQAPASKQKVVEIEDDDSDITDSPAPYDKVEPTTRRPIIDNVSDIRPENRTEKKDIEIITNSYVPTINRRPTKVVLERDSSEESMSDETTTRGPFSPDAVKETAQNSSEMVSTTSHSGSSEESTVTTSVSASSASQ